MLRGGARFLHKKRLANILHTAYTQAMGPFSSKRQLLALGRNLDNYAVTLAEVKLELAQVKSEFRNLEMEWANCFEKLKSISGRIAKRQALEGIEAPQILPEPGNGETEPDAQPGVDPISAGILHRRNLGKPIA